MKENPWIYALQGEQKYWGFLVPRTILKQTPEAPFESLQIQRTKEGTFNLLGILMDLYTTFLLSFYGRNGKV